MNRMSTNDPDTILAGSLLVAHPTLHDPNFSRSVILLTAHSPADGSIGVIVNRPMSKKLSEIDSAFEFSRFGDVPLFEGGPVAKDQLILVAWKWCLNESSFKLYFGIDTDRARELMEEDSGFEIIGFMGHAGWSGGQLESELKEDAWIPSQLISSLDSAEVPADWFKILAAERPDLQMLAFAPKQIGLN